MDKFTFFFHAMIPVFIPQTNNLSKFIYFSILISGLLVSSCNSRNNLKKSISKNESITVETKTHDLESDSRHLKTDSIRIKRRGLDQLVDISTVNSTIHVDLKYASTDNFMKRKLYTDIDRLYLQKDVAIRLGKCQEFLKKIRPDLSLLVYDGVRPLSVQREMWNALDSIPVAQRIKFVSNPANGSIHNYGAAVDLTLCDALGIPMDMGAGYDDIREIAFPKYEDRFLKSGELTLEQIENRILLRKVMQSQNFRNIPTEWWHFNAFSRDQAKRRYDLLE